MLGATQSGRRSHLRLLSLLRDADLIRDARAEAITLVEEDPELDGIRRSPPRSPPWSTRSAPNTWRRADAQPAARSDPNGPARPVRRPRR